MATKKSKDFSPTKTVLDLASKFVHDKGGAWNHDEWESALKQVEETGMAVEDEVKRHFGNLLEAAKYFYHLETQGGAAAEAAATPRSAKPRAKATAKTKAKPKAKAKAKPAAKKKPTAG